MLLSGPGLKFHRSVPSIETKFNTDDTGTGTWGWIRWSASLAGCLAAVFIASGAGKLLVTEPTAHLLAALVPGVAALRFARADAWVLAVAEIALGGCSLLVEA